MNKNKVILRKKTTDNKKVGEAKNNKQTDKTDKKIYLVDLYCGTSNGYSGCNVPIDSESTVFMVYTDNIKCTIQDILLKKYRKYEYYSVKCHEINNFTKYFIEYFKNNPREELAYLPMKADKCFRS